MAARLLYAIVLGIPQFMGFLGVPSTGCGLALAAYPERPVRFLVPLPPGGSPDLVSRTIANGLSGVWPQTIVVDNRPGANHNLAAELAAKSAPDGYTWLLTTDHILTVNPHLGKTPFARIGAGLLCALLAGPVPAQEGWPARAVRLVVPSSPGGGTDIQARLLAQGLAEVLKQQAVQRLLRGDIAFMASDVAPVLPQIRSGRVMIRRETVRRIMKRILMLLGELESVSEAKRRNRALPG